jgi:hypothetical protein
VLGLIAGRAMAGWPPAVVAVVGGVVVLTAFAGLARLAGVDEATAIASQLKRRIRNDRLHRAAHGAPVHTLAGEGHEGMAKETLP